MNTGIWWIRRDLRLTDNEALTAVLRTTAHTIPVFIMDPALLSSSLVGSNRLAFLWASLHELDADLRRRGSYLTVRLGKPNDVLAALQRQTGAEVIFAEADYSPYARQRDKSVAAHLPLRLLPGVTVHSPDMVMRGPGQPYVVFTPYSKQWRERPFPHATAILPAPDHIATPPNVNGYPLLDLPPALPPGIPFPPGEAEAQRRLHAFTQSAIYRYADERNRVDLNATSQLSPYLRFGMISARQVALAARTAIAAAPDANGRAAADAFLNELIWREFYIAILYHFPYVRQGSFHQEYNAIAWNDDPEQFAAWQNGQTGFPIVDAAMRQLRQTGWMHNRARMIVASFLVKDLLINWQKGERYFMQQLVDGDLAVNNGGWQWTAGVGTDAAPYFRIFNPTLQGVKFDPMGAYVRHWVPELTAVPDAYIHQPAAMPLHVQQQCGVRVGRDYPHPIIDRAVSRPRTLAAYQAVKKI